MKPTTGRPWKTCAPATVATAPVEETVPVVEAASDVRPVPTAFAPAKARSAQPFGKLVESCNDTAVTLTEPRTSDVTPVLGGVGAFVEPLRMLTTVDSQHSEFGAAAGGSGEKSTPLAVALRSSRLKYEKDTVSHAPDVVSTLVNGVITVAEVTNWRLVGNVSTQSVFDFVPASSTYSLMTSECIIVAEAARTPAVAVSVPAVMGVQEETYTFVCPATVLLPLTTTLTAGLVSLKFGVSLPISE